MAFQPETSRLNTPGITASQGILPWRELLEVANAMYPAALLKHDDTVVLARETCDRTILKCSTWATGQRGSCSSTIMCTVSILSKTRRNIPV
jgi:hypothetical protein